MNAPTGGYGNAPHVLTPAQGPQVVQVLCHAASADASVRVPAHQHLQQLENSPNFVSLLLEAYSDASVDPQGRFLAVVMCKNVIDRHWQPRSGFAIADEEKTHVRGRMLQLLGGIVTGSTPAPPHFTEFCMVLRRICRFDFPQRWGELVQLFDTELQKVQCRGFDEHSLYLIVALHHVLKEQTAKKLITARKAFFEIGKALVGPLGRVWMTNFEQMRQMRPEGLNDQVWKLSRYLDGCLLVTCTQGFDHLHDAPNGAQMVQLLQEKLGFLLSALSARQQLLFEQQFFLKNLKSAIKWWASLLHAHPLAFDQANVSSVLRTTVELLKAWCDARGREGHALQQLPEVAIRNCLQLITHACNTTAFRRGPQPAHEGKAKQLAETCHAQFLSFVQSESVASLCELACSAALRFSGEDLAAWLADPEDQLQGPSSFSELRVSGEQCVRALSQPPLEQPLIEHLAQRMAVEAAAPPTLADGPEVILRRDAFLWLLQLCQPKLRPLLQFSQLLAFFAPFTQLVPQMGPNTQAITVLLPVRVCGVLRAWAADIPQDAVMPVLQLLGGFLQPSSPKAVRLAALGPLRTMLDRFSDHEAWAQLTGPFIDSCLEFLRELQMPECQWRCLHLIQLLLSEEAESGRYEVQARCLEQMIALWRQPDKGEQLICHAVLDVLKALVLMSCPTKTPSFPLPPALLSCCLLVISDCFTGIQVPQNNGMVATGSATSAALAADATSAAGGFGNEAHVSSTLIDSGAQLFLGILRTVSVDQSAQLMNLFPTLLKHYEGKAPSDMHDGALDIILEYCVLITAQAGGPQALQPHYGSIVAVCRQGLEGSSNDRTSEQCFRIVQLLLAYVAREDNLQLMQTIMGPLLAFWAHNFDVNQPPGAFKYPLHTLLQLFCTWQVHQKVHFLQNLQATAPDVLQVAVLILGAAKLIRLTALRISILFSTLTLLEGGAGARATEGFWKEFMRHCEELLISTRKNGNSVQSVARMMQALRSTVSQKLPAPVRSQAELIRCVLPADLCLKCFREGGVLDESAAVQWFFGHCSQALKTLSAAQSLNLPGLIALASPDVQNAFRATGM